MKMKGEDLFEINIHEQVFVLIGGLLVGIIALAVIYVNLTPMLSNTPIARASLTAHTLAFYLGSLSSVDAGTVEKSLGDTCIVQIGKYSATTMFFKATPVSNYFLKVFLYDEKGAQLAVSEEVSFIGNLDVSCQNTGICLTTDRITFITFAKNPGEAVKLTGFKTAKESGFSLCKAPTQDEIESYVEKYSAQYNVEKAFILAVMGAESYMQQCDRYGYVKHSTVNGVPTAFGLMQMTPSTARGLEKQFGVQMDVEDPEQNVMAGVLLLSTLLKNYEGYDNRKELAVANYNCGGIENAVAKYCKDKKGCWEKIKPHMGKGKEYCTNSDETIPYVERVMRLYGCFDSCLKSNGECYAVSPCQMAWDAPKQTNNANA